jgi:hypothetical protein
MVKTYTVTNAENEIVMKIAANNQKEAAKRVKARFGNLSVFLNIKKEGRE